MILIEIVIYQSSSTIPYAKRIVSSNLCERMSFPPSSMTVQEPQVSFFSIGVLVKTLQNVNKVSD